MDCSIEIHREFETLAVIVCPICDEQLQERTAKI